MGTVWELDFYSRPILDENQKKLWEVLVCESPMTIDRSPDDLFRYAKYCTNSEVNSIWLGSALQEAIAQAPSPPTTVRFFRRQMNNMIVKTCKDLGLEPVPSRRTIALWNWLRDRNETVYPQDPNFQAAAAQSPTVRYLAQTPQRLPDAVEGKQWAIVTLEAAALQEMSEWEIDFSEAFPLELANLEPTTPVPGLLVFSDRAFPLAAWMSGLEMAFLKFDPGIPPRLLLESGANNSWILANLTDKTTQAEAQNLEDLKKQADGVHFLAVQGDPDSESFNGFWLLKEGLGV